RELIKLTGRTLDSISSRRQRLGFPHLKHKPWKKSGSPPRSSRSGGFWTKAEDALLGTMPDRRLAKKLGRSFKAVRARRHAKRISFYRKWLPKEDKVLGTRTDLEVAKRIRRTPGVVADRRRALGIACFEARRPSTVAEKLARMSDRQIARLLRQSHKFGRRPRMSKPSMAPSKWTPAEDRLLGKWPDERLARFLGRTRKAVESRRLGLGIRYCPPGRRWTPHEERLLDPARYCGRMGQRTR